jgi:hypothetical protein
MGQYVINAGVLGKGMRAVGKTGTPDGKPAWVFENQTGDLGTLLNSSIVWCGVNGSINVIPAGTSLSSVSTLSKLNAGTGYSALANLPTTCSNNMAQGLTLTITETGGVIDTAVIGNSAGSGYNVGDIVTVVQTGGANGRFTITAVNAGIPIAAQSIEFKVVAGSVLPIAVDYITGFTTITDADIVICK